MKHYGDITALNGAELPVVDCITGGSPCQDLSIAGRREGLAGERSGLFMEQVRIVKEMREEDKKRGRTGAMVRPRFLVWENVPGAFSSNKGRDFQAVLTEIVRIAEPEAPDVPLPDKGKWPKAGCLYDDLGGWSVAWRVHDAQFWGVPQRRKRISLVADFGGLAAPEVLFERKGLSWHPDESEPAGEEAAAGTGGGVDRQMGARAGNIGYEVEVSPTLNAGKEMHVYDARGNGDGQIAPTITGDHQNRVTDYTAVCVGNGQLHQISMAEQCNTLDTMHDQRAVLCFQNTGQGWWNESDIGATLRTPCDGDSVKANLVAAIDCRNHKEIGDISGCIQAKNAGYSLNYQNPVRVNQTVRRLTPLECERLQGYPDGWTDSKGKKHRAADSPRYKALGNSIALPFWFWLLRRISAQYERPATLGSLFDGIGGFPLCWERCNGKGTAVWASEIEEFPIAVTKKHFPE